jgi:aminoglycoside phosphotransferase
MSPMTCELFDNLKLMNFSDVHRCIYEDQCPFARSLNVNLIEASETCKAIKDVKEDDFMTVEDALQDIELRKLISARRLN